MDNIGFLNFAVDTFFLQIFVVSLLFCMRSEKRTHFYLRLFVPGCGCLLFFFFVPVIRIGFFNVSFVLLFLANSLIIWLCFRIRWKQILFYNVIAGTLQNLVAKVVTIFSLLGWVEERTFTQLLLTMLLFAAATVIFYIIFVRRTNGNPDFEIQNVKFAVLLIVSALVIFPFSQFADWFFGGGYARMFLCANFITIDLVVLFMAFGVFEKSYLENEKEIVSRMLDLQKGQMQQTEEEIEQINRKCHDMLRTIELLENQAGAAEKTNYVSELKRMVHHYDAACKTGNRALDVVLTKYSLVCEEREISFTYMADGRALAFMEDCDLYSFLGNALENAVEALMLEAEKSKRVLELFCKREEELVVVEIENTFCGELSYRDGIPATTKEDDGYHGYGIKSMRYVTEKYGGSLYVGKEGNDFIVRALFPL